MNRNDIINDPDNGNKAEAYEAFDDIPTNPNLSNTIGDVINARYGRRDVLRRGTRGLGEHGPVRHIRTDGAHARSSQHRLALCV